MVECNDSISKQLTYPTENEKELNIYTAGKSTT